VPLVPVSQALERAMRNGVEVAERAERVDKVPSRQRPTKVKSQ
jgi:hypothetical protein